jgi:sec-independent protein translocase protein TatB
MIDLGVSKLALIAVVALVVIGPERLPKVARMAGNLLGRAQRYMAEVKSEVNRQVELDELKKMQEAATSAVKDVQSSMSDVGSTINEAKQGLSDSDFNTLTSSSSLLENYDDFADNGGYGVREPKTNIRQGRDSWGVKKTAMPQWYKRNSGVKTRIQSGAARVKRFRRAASQQKTPKSFF